MKKKDGRLCCSPSPCSRRWRSARWRTNRKKDETAAETAQTAPDAEGTLRFENLSARMKTGYYTVMSLEENIAAIECIDYDKMYEDLRDGLNQIAEAQWMMLQIPGAGETYTYKSLQDQYDALRKTFDDIKDGKLQQDNADLVRQLRDAENQLLMAGQTLYINLLGWRTSPRPDPSDRGA